jgi:hypothetical protein
MFIQLYRIRITDFRDRSRSATGSNKTIDPGAIYAKEYRNNTNLYQE